MAQAHELAEKDYILGMKYKDIAAKYGVTVNTVKSWKVRYKWLKTGTVKKNKSVQLIAKVEEEDQSLSLTDMQEKFATEYLIDLNATQAAIRAGYSSHTAQEQSSRLMKNEKVKDFIDKAIAERSRRTGITQERVLEELAKIAFADMRKFAKWSKEGIKLLESGQLTEEDAACVSELSETVTQFGGSIKFKLHDKKGALELLGRHLKLFTDKLEIKDSTDRAQSMKKARERVRNGQTAK